MSFGFCNSLSPNVPKTYVSADQLLEDSFRLAKEVYESDFKPTYLIALWRGGSPIGIAVEEYFRFKKQPIINHTAVRVSAYNHDKLKPEVTVFNLDYIVKTITSEDRLLIIDDVVDSGASIEKTVSEIQKQCGKNTPKEIKIAAVYYKPAHASIKPDYYLYANNNWIVFPHELEGLTSDELKRKSKNIAEILK